MLHLSRETVGRKVMGKSKSPVFTLLSSYLYRALRRPGVSAYRRPPELDRIDFTHTHREKTKQGPLNPSVRHLYVCKQDVGG